MSVRCARLSLLQGPVRASVAALTAASISACPPSATAPTRLPSTGDSFVNCRSETEGTKRLSMKCMKLAPLIRLGRYGQARNGSNEKKTYRQYTPQYTPSPVGTHTPHRGSPRLVRPGAAQSDRR